MAAPTSFGFGPNAGNAGATEPSGAPKRRTMREMARDPVAQALAENGPNGSAPAVAEAIEEVIYDKFKDEKNKEYRKLMQDVTRKLKGQKNMQLREAILNGAISPEEVVNSDAKKLEELAKAAKPVQQPSAAPPAVPPSPVSAAPPVMPPGTSSEQAVDAPPVEEVPGPSIQEPIAENPMAPEVVGQSNTPSLEPPPFSSPPPAFGATPSDAPPMVASSNAPPVVSGVQETATPPVPSPTSANAPPPMGAPPMGAPPAGPPGSIPPSPSNFGAPSQTMPKAALGGPPLKPPSTLTPPGVTPFGVTPPGVSPPGMPLGVTPPGVSAPGVTPLGVTAPSVTPPNMQQLPMTSPVVPPSPEKKRPPALNEVPSMTSQPIPVPLQVPLAEAPQEIAEVHAGGGARSKALEALRFARSQAQKRRAMGDTLGIPSPARSLKKDVVANEVQHSPAIPAPPTPGEAAREAAVSRLKAERLSDEVAQLQKQLSEERAAASAREQALEDKAGRLEAERKQLEEKLLEGFTAAGDETQAQLAESQAKVSMLTREAADAKVEFEELKGELGKLRMEKEEWNEERDEMRNQADSLTAEKAGIQAEAEKLQSEKAELARETQDQADKMLSLQNAMAQLEADNSKSLEECRRLSLELKDNQELMDCEREEARVRLSSAQFGLTSAPSMSPLQAEVEQLRAQNADLSKQLELRAASKDGSNSPVTAAIMETPLANFMDMGEASHEKAEAERLQNANAELHTQVQRLNSRIEELIRENDKLQRTAVTVEASADTEVLTQELEDVKGNLQRQTQECRIAQQENLSLQGELASARATFTEERTALLRKNAEAEAAHKLEVQKFQVHQDTLQTAKDSLEEELQLLRRDRRSKVKGLLERSRSAVEAEHPRSVAPPQAVESEGTGVVQSLAGMFDLGTASQRSEPRQIPTFVPPSPPPQAQAPVTSVAGLFGSDAPAVASNTSPFREPPVQPAVASNAPVPYCSESPSRRVSIEPETFVSGLFGSPPKPAREASDPSRSANPNPFGAAQLFASSNEATESGVAGLFGGQPAVATAPPTSVAGLFGSPPAETTSEVFEDHAESPEQTAVSGLFGGPSVEEAHEVLETPVERADFIGVAGLFGSSEAPIESPAPSPPSPSGVSGLFGSPPVESSEETVSEAFGESAPPTEENFTSQPVGVAGMFGESAPEVASDGVAGLFGSQDTAETQEVVVSSAFGRSLQMLKSLRSSDPPPNVEVPVGVAGLFGSPEDPPAVFGDVGTTEPAAFETSCEANVFGNSEPQASDNGVAGLFGSSEPVANDPNGVSSVFATSEQTDDSIGVAGCFGGSEPLAPELGGVSNMFASSEQPANEPVGVAGLFGSPEEQLAPELSGVSSVFGNTEPQADTSGVAGCFGSSEPAPELGGFSDNFVPPAPETIAEVNGNGGVAGLFGSSQPLDNDPSGVSSVFGNSEPHTNDSVGVAGCFGSSEPTAPELGGVSSVFASSEPVGVAGCFGSPEEQLAPELAGVSSVFGGPAPQAQEIDGVAGLFGSPDTISNEPSGVASIFGNSVSPQTNGSTGVAGCFGSSEDQLAPELGVSSVFGDIAPQAQDTGGVAGLFGSSEPISNEPSGVSSVFANPQPPQTNGSMGVAACFGSSEPMAPELGGVSSVFGNSAPTNEMGGVAGCFAPAAEVNDVSSVFGNSEPPAPEPIGVASAFGNSESFANPSGVSGLFGSSQPPAPELTGVAGVFGGSVPENSGVAGLFGTPEPIAPPPQVSPPPVSPFASAPPVTSQAPAASGDFFSGWGVGDSPAPQATGVASLFS